MTNNLENILQHLSEDDRRNFEAGIETVSTLFKARNGGIEIGVNAIAQTQEMVNHIMSGGEYPLDVEACLASLRKDPTIQTQLIATELEETTLSRIANDTKDMSREDKLSYARKHGLTKPRGGIVNAMTTADHHEILKSLNPSARMSYARRHGIL